MIHPPDDASTIANLRWDLATAKTELAKLRDERDALRTALADAIECIESWGAYATPYFRDKWDLDGDIKRLEAVLEQKPCRD